MRRLLGFAALVTVVCLPSPAQANLISPIDPFIGVRGTDTGSPPVTDASIYALEPCAAFDAALTNYFCAPYENNLETQIFSLDLSFWDSDGLPIPTTVQGEFGAVPNYFPAQESEFPLLLNVDNFTVRLCDTSTAGQDACDAVVIGLLSIPVGGSLVVFSDVDGYVSIRAVNLQQNDNLPPNDQRVPEPALLLLFGMAGIGAVRRGLSR